MIEDSESLTDILDEQAREANEPETTQKQYRFNWSLLGEAELFLANEQSLYCAFSRAILKDYQLMKASERKPPPMAAGKDAEKDSLCKLFEQKINFGHQHMKTSKPKLTANNIDIRQEDDESSSAYYQPNAVICAETKSSISDSIAFDTADQSAVTELQQNEMASMGLPMEFSKSPSAEKKKKGKRKRKKAATECVNNSDNWMIGLDFENYWSLTGEYVTNMTWLNDFGTQMDEKVREEQMARTLECKPNNLLECHRSLKDYTNIVYSKEPTKEFTTWEELYQRHCELVKAKTKEDFERLQQQSALSRCKQFIETITALKFVPGYEMVNESEANCCDNSTKMSNDPANKMSRSSGVVVEDAPISGNGKEQVQPTRKKKLLERSLVSYGDMEMFDDVYADFYAEPSYSSNQQKPTVHTSKTSFSEANVHQPFSSNDDEMTENDRNDDHQDGEDDEERLLSMDEKLKFDFGFDEKRDAHLIAKNCFSVFANDRKIKKYLYQRFRLFSRFNDGVLMDRDGWFSVTPERVAEHMADRIVRRNGAVIIDAFTGVGGNAIQFALKGAFVIAIDLDPVRLRCAAQNAKVYGVADRINFICTDFFHFAQSPRLWSMATPFSNEDGECDTNQNDRCAEGVIDAIFLSPPWGGPSYLKMKEFDLNTHLTPNGFDIFNAAKKITSNIAYFLPRQTTVGQLVSLAGPGGSCEIEQNLLNTKIKAITAYYGNLVTGRCDDVLK